MLVGTGHAADAASSSCCIALAACLTAGIANIAAARKVTLTEVRSTVDGRHRPQRHPRELQPARNGYEQVYGVGFIVSGDAAPEEVLARDRRAVAVTR